MSARLRPGPAVPSLFLAVTLVLSSAGAAHALDRGALQAAGRMLQALRGAGPRLSLRVRGFVARNPVDSVLAPDRPAPPRERPVDLGLGVSLGDAPALLVETELAPPEWLREQRPDVATLGLHVAVDGQRIYLGVVPRGRGGAAGTPLTMSLEAPGVAEGGAAGAGRRGLRGLRNRRRGGGAGGDWELGYSDRTLSLKRADGSLEVLLRHDAAYLPDGVQIWRGEEKLLELQRTSLEQGEAARVAPPLGPTRYRPMTMTALAHLMVLTGRLPARIAPPRAEDVFAAATPRAPRRGEAPRKISPRALARDGTLPFDFYEGMLRLFDDVELAEMIREGVRKLRGGLVRAGQQRGVGGLFNRLRGRLFGR